MRLDEKEGEMVLSRLFMWMGIPHIADIIKTSYGLDILAHNVMSPQQS